MDQETIIIVSVFGCACAVLLLIASVLCCQVRGLRRRLDQLYGAGAGGNRMRVQKLTMDDGKNHAFHNPGLAPDEELSKRGYSMYMGSEQDVESARDTERQTGGQYVDELSRELEKRHQRQAAPPFLLQSIEESKRKRDLANPAASNHSNPIAHNHNQSHNPINARQSVTNPNFIY